MTFIDLLTEARRGGGALIDVPPCIGLAEGYGMQAALAERLGETIGWKIGATSAPARAVLGVAEPIHGRVFAGGVLASGAMFDAGSRGIEVEPEVIVEVGAGLKPVRAWVGLELVRPSRDDALEIGAAFIIADNAAHVGLVLGSEVAIEALHRPDAIGVRLLLNDAAVQEGGAARVDGGPLGSVEWLERARDGTARPLRPGDLVATGAMARAVAARAGDRVMGDFGAFGRTEVRVV